MSERKNDMLVVLLVKYFLASEELRARQLIHKLLRPIKDKADRASMLDGMVKLSKTLDSLAEAVNEKINHKGERKNELVPKRKTDVAGSRGGAGGGRRHPAEGGRRRRPAARLPVPRS